MFAIMVCSLLFVIGGDSRAVPVSDLMEPGVPYVNLDKPTVLQLDDVDRWCRFLNADDEQIQFMHAQFVKFVDRHNEFMQTSGRDYLRRCGDLGFIQQRSHTTSPEFVEASKTLERHTDRFHSGLEQIENQFLDSLIPVMTDDQVGQLYLLRFEASRRQSRSTPARGRWSGLDLRLVWEIVAKNVDEKSDLQEMNVLLASYESQVTPLLEHAAKQVRSCRVALNEIIAQEAAGGMDGNAATVAYQAAWNRVGDAFQSIRRVTEGAVLQSESVLSPQTAERFVMEARTTAFPELYPYPGDLTPLFKRLSKCAELDDKKRDDVLSLLQGYKEEYRAMCVRMESHCIDWGDKNARGVNGYQHQFLATSLEPLFLQRDSISSKWLQILNDSVGEDLVTANTQQTAERQLTPEQIRASGKDAATSTRRKPTDNK